MTSGPVMNMCEVWSTITVKSVIAGSRPRRPRTEPTTREICGITPDACVLRRKISPYRPSALTPSWMRAPPESLMPITGQPVFRAKSITLTIFWPKVSPRAPPKTVKSWEKTATGRPSTVPYPVTTPSP